MDGRTNEQTNRQTDGLMDGQTDKQTNGQKNTNYCLEERKKDKQLKTDYGKKEIIKRRKERNYKKIHFFFNFRSLNF
jgi:hypothetical protein